VEMQPPVLLDRALGISGLGASVLGGRPVPTPECGPCR
jgi:hypothetical protein